MYSNGRFSPFDDAVAQSHDAHRILGHFLRGNFGGNAKADDAGDILGASAGALLPTPNMTGASLTPSRTYSAPTPLGRKVCAPTATQIDRQGAHIERYLAAAAPRRCDTRLLRARSQQLAMG